MWYTEQIQLAAVVVAGLMATAAAAAERGKIRVGGDAAAGHATVGEIIGRGRLNAAPDGKSPAPA